MPSRIRGWNSLALYGKKSDDDHVEWIRDGEEALSSAAEVTLPKKVSQGVQRLARKPRGTQNSLCLDLDRSTVLGATDSPKLRFEEQPIGAGSGAFRVTRHLQVPAACWQPSSVSPPFPSLSPHCC